ncbi:MAG: type VI secretion system tip protein TssI/VgrG [Pseudomonadota bacterium]
MPGSKVDIVQLEVQIQGLEDQFRVTEFSAQERLSQPFRYSIDLVSENHRISHNDVLTKACRIGILDEEGNVFREANGVVAQFEYVARSTDWALYRAEVVPKLQFLAHRFDCRIFNDKNVLEIVEDVLQRAEVRDYRTDTTEQYPPHEYVVQYRESDLNFICRLLEDAGMFYFFEHKDGAHNLVISDTKNCHTAIPNGSDTIEYNDNTGLIADDEAMFRFAYGESVMTNQIALRDFDFEKPTGDHMQVEAPAAGGMVLEAYDFPGMYVEPKEGDKHARVRHEALMAAKHSIHGATTCRRMTPGYYFTLENHDIAEANQRYLITSTNLSASQPAAIESQAGGREAVFHVDCTTIPLAEPYRAPRRARRPVVEGIQTATVVGDSDSDEIFTDAHGRIKVKFHWDRREEKDRNSSGWVRIATAWAGAQWGAFALPRVGQEVVVNFLEGNPDAPLVTGSVYNGQNKPPYPLPENKTQSTLKSNTSPSGNGFNELRFEDKRDAEEVFMHAQKDMNQTVKNNKSVSVGAKETLTVGDTRSQTVEKDETITGNANRTTRIKGDDVETVTDGMFKVTVDKGNNELWTSTGEQKIFTEAGAWIRSPTKIELISGAGEQGKLVFTGDNEIVLSCGKSSITLKKSGDIEISCKEFKVGGQKVSLTASQETAIGVSSQVVKSSPAKLELSGAAINSSAVGMHEITGALVKIN